MSAEPVDIEIERLERALRLEDPDLIRRCRRFERREFLHVMSVFALLAAGAVLLATGFAITSMLAWCAGTATYLLAFVADSVLRPDGPCRQSQSAQSPTQAAALSRRREPRRM